jgi:hypothetical protein
MFYEVTHNDHDALLAELVKEMDIPDLIELRKACLDIGNQVQANIVTAELERKLAL